MNETRPEPSGERLQTVGEKRKKSFFRFGSKRKLGRKHAVSLIMKGEKVHLRSPHVIENENP